MKLTQWCVSIFVYCIVLYLWIDFQKTIIWVELNWFELTVRAERRTIILSIPYWKLQWLLPNLKWQYLHLFISRFNWFHCENSSAFIWLDLIWLHIYIIYRLVHETLLSLYIHSRMAGTETFQMDGREWGCVHLFINTFYMLSVTIHCILFQ